MDEGMASMGQAIGMDPLNHHAYYNLFSMQLRSGEGEAAFKSLCCCLSVGHLLLGRRGDETSL